MAMFDTDISVSSAAPVHHPFAEADPNPDILNPSVVTAAYEIAAPVSPDSTAAEESPVAEECAPLEVAPLPLDPTFITAAALSRSTPEHVTWIAEGFVAAGTLVVLDGKPKAGKSAFVASLVSAVLEGRPFLDRPTMKTPVIFLTEEGKVTFRRGLVRAGLTEATSLHIPLHQDVRGASWTDIMGRVAGMCAVTGAKLVVIDTLAMFEPSAEGSASKGKEAVDPLHQLKNTGVGVVVTRHQRKAGGIVGDSGRGSSALTGHADIVLALSKPDGHGGNTRVITASSRFQEEIPARRVVERRDRVYVDLGDVDVTAGEAELAVLALLSPDPALAVAVDDLLAIVGLKKTAERAVLERLLKAEKVVATGAGTRGSPRRYHLRTI
jgi:hypothetical protein